MTDQPPEEHADDLQFDQAEYTEPKKAEGPTCVACRKAITDRYYQVQGAILCENCSQSVRAHLTGGSVFGRFFKGSVLGVLAAIAGAAIYYGVFRISDGRQFSLISILVGYMVGRAVHKGSQGRGGLLYQLLAVFLTYFAIALSYGAIVIQEARNARPDANEVIAGAEADKPANRAEMGEASAKPEATNPAEAGNGPGEAEPKPLAAEAGAGNPDARPLTILALLFGLVAFGFALPVLAGTQSPMIFLIVGFALFQAFKINTKQNVVITGPHAVGPGPDDLVPVYA